MCEGRLDLRQDYTCWQLVVISNDIDEILNRGGRLTTIKMSTTVNEIQYFGCGMLHSKSFFDFSTVVFQCSNVSIIFFLQVENVALHLCSRRLCYATSLGDNAVPPE